MKNNWELNDLYNYGYKIYQCKDYFKFSLDSIILADFVKIDYTDKKLLDICTGNAPIPIILSNKNIEITGIEIQKEIFELAIESININNIKNVTIINDDIKNYHKYFKANSYDIITCNPPYFKYDENSNINENEFKSIARHEIKISLEEVIKISNSLLNNKGKLYLVHRTERFIEIVNLLNKYNFGIKTIQCCYNSINDDCSMILIEAKKNSKDNVIIKKPIITNNYRGDIK